MVSRARPAAAGDGYLGRHRPASRRRLLVKVAVVLGAVAVVLAGLGVVIATTVDPAGDEGVYRAGAVAEMCPLVDAEPLGEFGLSEERREADDRSEPRPAAVGCRVLLTGEEEDARYVTAELRASLRVYAGVNEALAGYSGSLDFERSEQREPELLPGPGEQAAFVVEAGEDGSEYRLRSRDSNATVGVTMFVSGLPAEDISNDRVKDALIAIGAKVLSGARSGL